MVEKLDCTGLMCPMPIVRVSKAVKSMASGDLLEVSADDAAFEPDIRAWCAKMNHTLSTLEKRDGAVIAVIRKT